MEKNSKNVLKNLLIKFINKSSIKNILIIDDKGKILVAPQKKSSEFESILNFFNEMDILKLKNNLTLKNLKKIIFDYKDYQIILTILQDENFILVINKNKKYLETVLNELSSLVNQINNLFPNKDASGKFHQINLDNIKKLEEYLKLMQPPKFKNIKKIIDYIS